MKLARPLAALALSSSLLLTACGDGGGDSDGSTDTPASEAGGQRAVGRRRHHRRLRVRPHTPRGGRRHPVTFTNDDSTTHTATSTEAPVDFDTGDLSEGDAEQITFDEAGTYEYRCDIHNSMDGRDRGGVTAASPGPCGQGTIGTPPVAVATEEGHIVEPARGRPGFAATGDRPVRLPSRQPAPGRGQQRRRGPR